MSKLLRGHPRAGGDLLLFMETWKEFEANELTHSATHYLFAVHDLLQEQGYARVTDVANKLNIARSSSSLGLKALAQKGFLKEDQNKFIQLTPKGKKTIEEIIGKKVILKRFFQDILQIPPHQAEIDTCKIEHLISSETGAKLLSFIRFMSTGNAQVKKVLQEFFDFEGKDTCPGVETCSICEGTCLKDLIPNKKHLKVLSVK